RPSHVARKALTAVNAQERARTIPRLHRAKTVACGLLKWGKWVWMIMVHSVTRGWQDITILLGVMGEKQPPIPCPTEGCLVISSMMSDRHLSKTYCRKEPGGRRMKQHVAPDRRLSIEDKALRHGRQSSAKTFNGFKEHFRWIWIAKSRGRWSSARPMSRSMPSWSCWLRSWKKPPACCSSMSTWG